MDFDVAFDWDDGKAASNTRKHGLSFETAIEVFLDDARLEIEDRRLDYGEPRFNVIGMISGRVVHVTFTVRNDGSQDVTWIISARLAVARERRWYHDGR